MHWGTEYPYNGVKSNGQNEINKVYTMTSKYIKQSKHAAITQLTLGRNVHNITKRDRFLDNGICIQLVKEIPMKVILPGDSLTLNEESIKSLNQFQKIVHRDHEYKVHGSGCGVFSIVSHDERFMVMGYEDQNDVTEKKGFLLGGEGYYLNALKIKETEENKFFAVKIFDSEIEEVNFS